MPELSRTESRISRNPEVLGGKPVIRGTRIAVSLVIDWIEAGVSAEQILEDYPNLTVADLDAAMAHHDVEATRTERIGA